MQNPPTSVETGGQLMAAFIGLHGAHDSVENMVVDAMADLLRWYANIPGNTEYRDGDVTLAELADRAAGHAEYEVDEQARGEAEFLDHVDRLGCDEVRRAEGG